jgi:hypothetical protein
MTVIRFYINIGEHLLNFKIWAVLRVDTVPTAIFLPFNVFIIKEFMQKNNQRLSNLILRVFNFQLYGWFLIYIQITINIYLLAFP